MKNISIREADIDDLFILKEFEQGVIAWERPFDPTIENDPINYYDLKKAIEDDGHILIVAEYENRLIGCGIGMEKKARHYIKYKTYAYLGLMYTHPDFRGQGVNAKIIDALKEWATSKGLAEIRLTVYDDNLGAIRAYEKVGFKKHIIEMRMVGK